MTTRIVAALFLVSLAALSPARVRAGNDDSILLGNDAALVGGAVTALVNDGSALWYNPAGLARADTDSVDVGASAFALRKYRMKGLLRVQGGGGGDATFTEFLSIPSALTFARRFTERIVGGLALFTSELSDYTLRASLEANDPTQQADFRLNTLLNGESALYHLALGLGFELTKGIHLGVSLFGDYASMVWSERTSLDLSSQQTVVVFASESSLEEQTALGFHARVGLSVELTRMLSLGLSVQTPSAYFYRSSHLTATESSGDLTVLFDGSGGQPLMARALDQKTKHVELGQYAPLRVRLGAALRVFGGTLSVEGDVQSPLRDRAFDVDRRFLWNLRAGGLFPWGRKILLGAGVFTDRAPERPTALGAGSVDYYGATLGGQYQSVRGGSVDAADGERSGLTFSTTVALRYAYGSGKFPGLLVPIPIDAAQEVARDLTVHELALHIGSGVYF